MNHPAGPSALLETRSPQEPGRRLAGDEWDPKDAAPVGDDLFASDDLVGGPVRPLGEDVGPKRADQVDRGGGVEDDDAVDHPERRDNLGAGGFALHRTARALQSAHRAIAVQADDEQVAGGARPGEIADMAGMEEIEATVREHDGFTCSLPGRTLLHKFWSSVEDAHEGDGGGSVTLILARGGGA